MADIIKTWPANMPASDVSLMFGEESLFSEYYFAIGRGKPKQPIERVWYTYQGRIIGSWKVDRMVVNDGSFPRLSSISGGEWTIKHDAYVLICGSGCERPRQRLYMSGFRGWRYFDFEAYSHSAESRLRI